MVNRGRAMPWRCVGHRCAHQQRPLLGTPGGCQGGHGLTGCALLLDQAAVLVLWALAHGSPAEVDALGDVGALVLGARCAAEGRACQQRPGARHRIQEWGEGIQERAAGERTLKKVGERAPKSEQKGGLLHNDGGEGNRKRVASVSPARTAGTPPFPQAVLSVSKE